jgi:broad specificity phosphatase PhoE
MHVVLFRHAERENSAAANPPLSARGWLQAEKILEKINRGELLRPTRLLSSPKGRAQQTLQKAADFLDLEVQATSDLDERQSSEILAHFQARIRRFFHSVEKIGKSNPGSVIYCCTHLDWIEEALPMLPSTMDFSRDETVWSPAQYLVFEIHDELWNIEKSGRIEV